MTELKPCPFCGGKATMSGVWATFTQSEYFYVTCANEDCAVNPASKRFDTEEEAAEAWNRRANE